MLLGSPTDAYRQSVFVPVKPRQQEPLKTTQGLQHTEQNKSTDSFQSLATTATISAPSSRETSPRVPHYRPLTEQISDLIRADRGKQLTTADLVNRLNAIQETLEADPNQVNQKDERGIPVINYALAAKIPGLTELLNAYHPTLASADAIQQAQQNLLHPFKHFSPGSSGFVLEQLQVPGVNVNHQSPHGGDTAVTLAAWHGSVDILRTLLTMPGVDTNLPNNAGKTALITAAQNGSRHAVRELLKFPQIDLLATDVNEKTALHTAAEWNRTEILGDLLQAIQDRLPSEVQTHILNKTDKDGKTALLLAAERGQLAMVRALRDMKGIDVTKADNNGKTPMMAATEYLATQYQVIENQYLRASNQAFLGINRMQEREDAREAARKISAAMVKSLQQAPDMHRNEHHPQGRTAPDITRDDRNTQQEDADNDCCRCPIC